MSEAHVAHLVVDAQAKTEAKLEKRMKKEVLEIADAMSWGLGSILLEASACRKPTIWQFSVK